MQAMQRGRDGEKGRDGEDARKAASTWPGGSRSVVSFTQPSLSTQQAMARVMSAAPRRLLASMDISGRTVQADRRFGERRPNRL
ncbi:hypothetical protein [Variovorax sp. CF079]|uniref:hypothetical protein n=1 Tax=Variovorax sp. CF079 TaxID=1882774 RepID=UPI00147C468E|nr:hypothetical protein [Variovorax sp. CF079]